MLVIRPQQMEALRRAMERQFENRALAHLRLYLPDECEALGETGVRATIRYAMHQARQYGFEEEYDILRYLNLMYALGFEFDADRRYTWAREILGLRHMQPRARMDLLTQRALKSLEPPPAPAEKFYWLPEEPALNDELEPEEEWVEPEVPEEEEEPEAAVE
ncbi:MAG: hypothetical protein AAB225_07270 [Acidobacteriota bacterium]